ncbi:Alcohol acetyltransferase [Gnomoniopsis smithogilvyi]|uniref:Alcohol acetyltransferase n=1 Tax=Gnomoniopsis smithogilvyi TaxID=1191159 RepID=A0A9W8YMB8_9PEZI|nr:Alcohol acetyltransferase [Gnomoniopsis smithogilvyi]
MNKLSSFNASFSYENILGLNRDEATLAAEPQLGSPSRPYTHGWEVEYTEKVNMGKLMPASSSIAAALLVGFTYCLLYPCMRFVSDGRKQMADTARRPRQYSWWVTGIGVLDASPQSDNTTGTISESEQAAVDGDDAWIPSKAQFSLSTESTAAAVMISPLFVAGPNGCLCVAGSWLDFVVDVSTGERTMVDLKQWLLQIATEG